jgi:hypothetical protein
MAQATLTQEISFLSTMHSPTVIRAAFDHTALAVFAVWAGPKP